MFAVWNKTLLSEQISIFVWISHRIWTPRLNGSPNGSRSRLRTIQDVYRASVLPREGWQTPQFQSRSRPRLQKPPSRPCQFHTLNVNPWRMSVARHYTLLIVWLILWIVVLLAWLIQSWIFAPWNVSNCSWKRAKFYKFLFESSGRKRRYANKWRELGNLEKKWSGAWKIEAQKKMRRRNGGRCLILPHIIGPLAPNLATWRQQTLFPRVLSRQINLISF